MTANLTLNLEARLDDVERIHATVDALAEAEDWEPELLFQIRLVLEEVGTNIVKYGYDEESEREKEIHITLTSRQRALTMEIVDDGKPFDPLSDAPAPDLDSALEDRPIGGLGVYLVRELVDEVYYRRDDGKNKLTLIKYRTP